MKLADQERGANVRRNLRNWWKPLLFAVLGWILLTVAVFVGAYLFAEHNDLSARRTRELLAGCGTVMVLLLIFSWLIVLIIADRKKSE